MTRPVLRPLGLGEILDVAFGLYRTLFLPLLTVTLAANAIPLALSVYIESSGGVFANLSLYFSNVFLNAVLSAIASAAATFIVSENYMGRSLTAGDAFSRAAPFMTRLILLGILVSFLTVLGLFLLIIPGIVIFTGYALSTPAMVIEGLPSATSAMGRSWGLTRGHRRKVFGALATVVSLIMLPMFALGGFAAASGDPAVMRPEVSVTGLVWMAVASLFQVMIYPLFYCVLTVAYYDLRVRKEAFDLEILASGLATS